MIDYWIPEADYSRLRLHSSKIKDRVLTTYCIITNSTLKRFFSYCLIASLVPGLSPLQAQKGKAKPLPPVSVNAGQLIYTPDANGNRVPDFSYCGYKANNEVIPFAPVRIVVPVVSGDATLRIQSALDYVASLPAGKDGFRGTVLLEKGIYKIAGGLTINASGVVLRGSGMGEEGTVLLAEGKDRQTLITIKGTNDRKMETEGDISDLYVPVNTTILRVKAPYAFKVGDAVLVRRPSTLKWIQELGTDHFGGGITALGWKPGTRDLFWDRKVVAVDGDQITLDAPLTTALDTTYGGGKIARYQWQGRIQQVGVENLRCVSTYDKDNIKDEAHRWMAVTLENISDAWVRQVVFQHFAGSAVAVYETANRVTVEDCKSLAPVSEIGGQRRYTFYTNGQQTIFQRCYAEYGYHDFAVGFTGNLNAFVQCESHLPYSFSGTIDSWASGILFDVVNVDGNALRYANRWQDAQGAGWSAANSVFWQCTAAMIESQKPPTANNWAFGCWAQFTGNGFWDQSNEHIQPRSLFYAQLAARLGDSILKRAYLLPVESEASSSPSVAVAALLTAQAINPAPLLTDWIDLSARRTKIPTAATGVKTIDQVGVQKPTVIPFMAPMQVQNGWLVRGSSIVTGGRNDVDWWRGDIRPYGSKGAGLGITRYVPGRIGAGLTDDLNELTDTMKAQSKVLLDHNYGLWYERRRDDHERIRRMDSEVWAPFYEQPFARSGQGLAWDGLSKYDLTKYNDWYWNRLKTFANLADQKGLVLIHQNYFQHNIIEAGAHYADFPWRPANNINETGFPEPVPYAGDKRVFMAEQFYDINNPVRRALHRAYIRKCLENFTGNTGVIQMISAEFTGPLHFVQFWLDVIAEWEKETGKHPLIGLSTTKDVQDAILADQKRAAIVDVIDIRYWHYQEDGKTYAPEGGQNLAPRQHARLLKPKRSSAPQVYRAVKEYKQKYPEKAILYSGDGFDRFGWAEFMAGGSLAVIPKVSNEAFYTKAMQMQPVDLAGDQSNAWALGNKNGEMILYTTASTDVVSVDLSKVTGSYMVRWIDPQTGSDLKQQQNVKGGKVIEVEKPKEGELVMWVSRK
jgi:Family of unknown function (DUF6298)